MNILGILLSYLLAAIVGLLVWCACYECQLPARACACFGCASAAVSYGIFAAYDVALKIAERPKDE